MTDAKVWFITGAGRGMGVDICRAALAAGNLVVATGRDLEAVRTAVGAADNLLVATLDVTRPEDADAAAQTAVATFGRIDVLVNNAGSSHKGYFEEVTSEQISQQITTNLLGPMNVTRAVLPVMRRQRRGHVISISSGAGLHGMEFVSAYAASKFGLEGWMESLAPEVARFGIATTIVDPGYFRSELRGPKSTTYAEPSIEDYADRTAAQLKWWAEQDPRAGAEPARLAAALLALTGLEQPPRRFVAGVDALVLAERRSPSCRNRSRPPAPSRSPSRTVARGCRTSAREISF